MRPPDIKRERPLFCTREGTAPPIVTIVFKHLPFEAGLFYARHTRESPSTYNIIYNDRFGLILQVLIIIERSRPLFLSLLLQRASHLKSYG